MNVAKWLLLMLLALPFLELAAFVVVAATIGFGWALILVLAGSLTGAGLRHATSNHIARVRVALGEGRFTALQADSDGGLVLFAGILLLIPGFITDALAVFPLVAPMARGGGHWRAPGPDDGVVDLTPEQWHQVPDPHCPIGADDDRNLRHMIPQILPLIAMLDPFLKEATRKPTPSLFPHRPYVSQPPRNQLRGARECS